MHNLFLGKANKKKKVTYNMHLHNHLKMCLLDFGPMHVFCAFPLRDLIVLLDIFIQLNPWLITFHFDPKDSL